ncbi:hypothetical protein F2P79_007214 [Pimephales promelas]|nr:hypothetical protein F2P79_007214 [Pimephales promelas]
MGCIVETACGFRINLRRLNGVLSWVPRTLKRESVKQPEVRLISIFSPVVSNIPAAEYILNNLNRNVLEFNTSHS